jgi:hypothetical protein
MRCDSLRAVSLGHVPTDEKIEEDSNQDWTRRKVTAFHHVSPVCVLTYSYVYAGMPRRHLANDKLGMHGSTAVPSCMFACCSCSEGKSRKANKVATASSGRGQQACAAQGQATACSALWAVTSWQQRRRRNQPVPSAPAGTGDGPDPEPPASRPARGKAGSAVVGLDSNPSRLVDR